MVSHTKLPSGNYQVLTRYTDPLTGQRKKATVTYVGTTRKAKRNAERLLDEKVDELISERQYDVKERITTFKELADHWFEFWQVGVSPQTKKREELVLRRVNEIIEPDILVNRMTPLLLEHLLNDYQQTYDSSYSTMIHIKSTLNKIFRFSVKHGLLNYTPMSAVELNMTREKRQEVRKKRKKKYLEPYELNAFFSEIKKRLNQNYFYLTVFLVYSGVRIGEAGALTKDDFDFTKNTVSITKNLLHECGYVYGPPKTEESERTILLPNNAMKIVKQAIRSSEELTTRYTKRPWKTYVATESIFRTLSGAPITSQSFRGVIARVERSLLSNCETLYGFKWVKHVTPHSFRYINITYLKDSEGVDIKAVQSHVGHVDIQTTLGIYAQSSLVGEKKLVAAMEKWDEGENWLSISPPVHYNEYSTKLETELLNCSNETELFFSLKSFKEVLGLSEMYSPRHISGNILPRLKKDLLEHYRLFDIRPVYGDRNRVLGYTISWEK
ncbi:hypothetical protein RV11_GL003213 [Enterococcus phoeniculicola]|uniref:Tyr recombinase domain-containing protein n=1 Tax=Enterococcus phoeniculicola ATCC BAA-412 TaxID=1158610 RepID=R3W5X3_9ENTE|nr:site-specific integrase [Enterococcus phoeniculicola]EOL42967.1 hypothetical protein UC3_01944 [Enterococcus phoeniculicola ATCC BAA-412]EOT76675.1 hypothetical protein I589_01632 [Enterococcus phoeniculicola ATCC BAA-412]OJG72242.1 hypothetical protein RV11_GL003213 [Enterococcus phoeniculicola]